MSIPNKFENLRFDFDFKPILCFTKKGELTSKKNCFFLQFNCLKKPIGQRYETNKDNFQRMCYDAQHEIELNRVFLITEHKKEEPCA